MIIEDGAFYLCELRAIRYGGTIEQCYARYRNWGADFYNKKISCTDGDVEI
jgi:hypothetical protein